MNFKKATNTILKLLCACFKKWKEVNKSSNDKELCEYVLRHNRNIVDMLKLKCTYRIAFNSKNAKRLLWIAGRIDLDDYNFLNDLSRLQDFFKFINKEDLFQPACELFNQLWENPEYKSSESIRGRRRVLIQNNMKPENGLEEYILPTLQIPSPKKSAPHEMWSSKTYKYRESELNFSKAETIFIINRLQDKQSTQRHIMILRDLIRRKLANCKADSPNLRCNLRYKSYNWDTSFACVCFYCRCNYDRDCKKFLIKIYLHNSHLFGMVYSNQNYVLHPQQFIPQQSHNIEKVILKRIFFGTIPSHVLHELKSIQRNVYTPTFSKIRLKNVFHELMELSATCPYKSFIQECSEITSKIFLYTKQQLCLTQGHSSVLKQYGGNSLFFGATGNIINHFGNSSKEILLYALLMYIRGNNNKKTILLPIAEGFLGYHDHLSIGSFFNDLAAYCLRNELHWPLCRRVITTWSTPIIQAVLCTFNKENSFNGISNYLQNSYKLLLQPTNVNFVVVQFCFCNSLNIAVKDIKCFFSNDEVIQFLKRQIIWAICCSNLKKFFVWLKYFLILLKMEKNCSMISTVKTYLGKFNAFKADVCCGHSLIEDITNDCENTCYESSPFYSYGHKIMKEINMDDMQSFPCIEYNPFYNPEYADLFLKKYVSWAPFWTNLLGKHLDNDSDIITDNPLDSYFTQIRNSLLKRKSSLLPTEYIRHSLHYNNSKLRKIKYDYLDDIVSN